MSDDYDKGFFAQLESQKSTIEVEFGGPIVWAKTPGKKQSKVFVKKTVDLEDREQWPHIKCRHYRSPFRENGRP